LISSWATTQPRLTIVMRALTFSARLFMKGLTALSKESRTPLKRLST